jgi:fructan beta-fructosidase
LDKIASKPHTINNLHINDKATELTSSLGPLPGQYRLKIQGDELEDLSIILSNDKGEKLIIGYNSKSNNYYINREQSGKVDFNKYFAATSTAPRLADGHAFDMTLVVDASSIELFADGGLSTMTALYFAGSPYNHIVIQSSDGIVLKRVSVSELKSVW